MPGLNSAAPPTRMVRASRESRRGGLDSSAHEWEGRACLGTEPVGACASGMQEPPGRDKGHGPPLHPRSASGLRPCTLRRWGS